MMVVMVMMVMAVMMLMPVIFVVIIVVMVFVLFIILFTVMMVMFMMMIVVMVVMMVMMLLFFLVVIVIQIQFKQAEIAAVAAFEGMKHGCCLQFGPGRRDHRCIGIQFAQEGRGIGQLFIADFLCAGQYERRSAFNLVLEEFTEVPEVDFRFLHVDDGDPLGHGQIRNDVFHAFYGRNDIRQFAYAGRLYDYPVGAVLLVD